MNKDTEEHFGASNASKEVGTETTLECSIMNSYKGCSQATAISRLLTRDKEFHLSVGSTGQGEAVWSSQQGYSPSNPTAFIGPTDFPSLSLEILLQEMGKAN